MGGVTVLWVYGGLMLAGGLMGWRAGSRASLVAGVGSGAALMGTALLARTHLTAGLWLGVAIAVLLCATFSARLLKTRKVMPAGALLALSLVALLLLAGAVARA
jgi:uncharacterized membrane protein (UPF0136 family)